MKYSPRSHLSLILVIFCWTISDGQKTCDSNDFRCTDGQCVPDSFRCDNDTDCEDESDEEACAVRCEDGYELVADNCEDIDECKNWTLHGCSQACVNHEGGYACNCFEGFKLSDHHTHCNALGDHPLIVYAYQDSIRKFNLNSTENIVVYSDLTHPVALEIDIYGGHVFWSDQQDGTIMMGSLDGELEKEEVVGNVDTVDDIGYDWIHNNLYWTENNNISVISMDTRYKRTLFSMELDKPRALVVVPRESLMFWSDWGSIAKIERAYMDGTSREVIIDMSKIDISLPNGLTIDYYSDKLFWVDAEYHMLASCDFYGQEISTILIDDAFVEHPFQLALFEDLVYWTDWQGHAIRSANKFNGNELRDVVGNMEMSTPNGIAVWQNSTQPLGDNYCYKARCSHISVAAPHHSCSCLCPDGIEMSPDGVTCVGEPLVTDGPTNRDSNHSSLIWIIIILVLALIFIIPVVITLFVWKRNNSGGKRSMNFGNPVYRNTPNDELFLSNSGHTTFEHNPDKASKYQPMIQNVI